MTALATPIDAGTIASTVTAPRTGTPHATTPAQALKVGRKFEAMYMTEMMQEMFAGLPTNGAFGGGQAEEMFRPMLIEQYGKLIANHGNGMGIAQAVARTLLQAQEAHR